MAILSKLGILHFKFLNSAYLNKISGTGKSIRLLSTSSKVMGVHATLKVQKGVGVVTLNSPGKVNVLNMEVQQDIENIIKEIDSNPSIRAGVLVSNKPGCFIAGADINMISSCKTAKEAEQLSKNGQEMLEKLEKSKKPFVAAIMGSCLGGGLEVALACHFRIAVENKTTFGLPEVLLGLLPATGGTQRLPQLIGLPNSLDMMLTGKNVRSEKAKALGLVDLIVSPVGPGLTKEEQGSLDYLQEIAVQIAQNLANGSLKINRQPKSFYDMLMKSAFQTNFVKNYVFQQAEKKVMKQTRGLYPAPLRILHAIREGLNKGNITGYKEEAKGFGELAMTKESKGLIHLFNGQTQCKKNKYGASKNNMKTIGIIGAGLMGAGIAEISIVKGYRTILKDVSLDGLARGEAQIYKAISDSVSKKKMASIDGNKYLSQLIPTIDYGYFAKADIIIESANEEIKIKHKILKEVENHIHEHCVFATNTSALSISDIAQASKRPENVIGMHYFSPVNKMQLLEIVTTEKTSIEAIRTAVDVGLKQGKLPVVVKDGPGFYTSRFIQPLVTEAFRLMVEGVDPNEMDRISMDMGFPIGCATLFDEVGLDVLNHVYLYFSEIFGERTTTFSPKVGHEFMEAGILGKKCGKGLFIYNEKTKQKTVNDAAITILKKYKLEPKVPLTDENNKQRILSRIVNEGVSCLQEGIISNPLDGDIAAVFGVGFPPFTGGPFHYLDFFGANNLVLKMREFEQHYGASFTPCELLLEYSKDPTKKFFN